MTVRTAVPTLAAVMMALLCARLGWWQLERGQTKQALLEQRAAAAQQTPRPVSVPEDLAGLQGQRVELYGTWLAQRQVLLDSQVQDGRVGVHVWTPLRLGAGALVLVNRGWILAPADRSVAPDVAVPAAGRVRVSGIWRAFPEPGLRADAGGCQPLAWPARLLYPTRAELECQFAQPVTDGLLLLDPDAADGFERRWADVGLPPERHYGYAAQWFALAATVVLIWLILIYRTLKHGDRD